MSTSNFQKENIQECTYEFKSTKESRLFRKFQKKWKEYFSEPDNEEEKEPEAETPEVEKIPKYRRNPSDDIKLEKKIYDYKSKKYVKTEV